MYDIAAKFPSKDAAGKVYTRLESTLKELRLFAHVSRLQLGNDFYVSLIYDGEESDISDHAKQVIQGLLSQGEVCRLPPETIATIQARRAERREKGIGTFTSHDETKVSYRTPIIRDAETHETIQTFPEFTEITGEEPYGPALGSSVHPIDIKDVPPELRQIAQARRADIQRKQKDATKPLFIRYRAHVEEIYNAEGEEGFDESIEIYLEQLKTMTPYLFAESAVKLFHAVLDEQKNDFPVPSEDIWIEFYEPLETPHGQVKALAVSQVNRPEAIKRVEQKMPGLKGLSEVEGFKESYLYRVVILDDAMQHLTSDSYDTELGRWLQFNGKTEESLARTVLFASWVRSLLLIIAREYATSPEPKPYSTHTKTYTEQVTKSVGHGKNRRIIQAEEKRQVEYHLVTFDVTTMPAARPSTQETPEDEKRQNWLTLHGIEHRIYKRVHFEDNARRYTGMHYHRLIERCVQAGGTFIEDGRQYTLQNAEDGEYYVMSSIADFDKYVPMLHPEYRRQVIKKVVATYQGTPPAEDTHS